MTGSVATALIMAILVVGAVGAVVQVAPAAAPPRTYGSWFLTVGGTENDQAWFGVAEDGDGGVVAVGETSSYTAGSLDAFVVKVDNESRVLWASSFGGTSSDILRDVAIDPQGNLYVVGMGRSYSAGSYDGIVARLDEFGNLVWYQVVGGEKLDAFWSAAIDSNGSLIACGYTMSFNASKVDIFVAKFDGEGRIEWAERLGGPLYDYCWSVDVDGEGNIYIGGQSSSFGTSYDGIIAKLLPDGRLDWMVDIDGGDFEAIQAIKAGENGSIYFAGNKRNPDTGDNDVWVGKYSPGSGLVFSETFGGPGNDVAYGIDLGENGTIYATGYTYSFITGSEGKADAFVAILNGADGTLSNFINIGGSYTEMAYALTIGRDGSVYITGKVDTFGAGGKDLMLAKLGKDYLELSEYPEMLWVNDDFPENVNVSKASPAVNETSFNVTLATPTFDIVEPTATPVDAPAYHSLPEAHVATPGGLPPTATFITTTETDYVTTTETVTETVTETETATETTTETVTNTLTTTSTQTETVTETTTQYETLTQTSVHTVTSTSTVTNTVTNTVTSTFTYTTTATKTVETGLPTYEVAGISVLLLVIGLVGGYYLRRK